MRRHHIGLVASVALCASLAACGSQPVASSLPSPRLRQVNAFCEQTLHGVRSATNFDTANALDDRRLMQAVRALRQISDHLRSSDRKAERSVSAAAASAAAGIQRYVREDQQDTAYGTTTFHDMYARLVNLAQVSGDDGLPACGLNTEA